MSDSVNQSRRSFLEKSAAVGAVTIAPGILLHQVATAKPDEQAQRADLLAEFDRLIGTPVVTAIAHRWRYSMPTNPLDAGFMDLGSGIWLAGEAFSGARIEGAFTSGRMVVEDLVRHHA